MPTISVDNHLIEYKLLGDTTPAVVFINDFLASTHTWSQVAPDISAGAQVLLYNRASVGRSGRTQQPQQPHILADRLRKMLRALDVEPPFVVVAHGLGGVLANLFIRQYREDVAGVVLVECVHPREVSERYIQRRTLARRALQMVRRVAEPYRYSERELLARYLNQERLDSPVTGLPLTVISGGIRPPEWSQREFDTHRRYQDRLLYMSDQSRQVLATGSVRYPQLTQPKLVVDAIIDLLTGLKHQ